MMSSKVLWVSNYPPTVTYVGRDHDQELFKRSFELVSPAEHADSTTHHRCTCALDGKFLEVTASLCTEDTAYTNLALGAHTDNTYFVRRDTANLLPCLCV